jgi:DNA mismatch repair protein MutS
MAGLPEEITERAKRILTNLERSDLTVHDNERTSRQQRRGRMADAGVQLTLFEMKADALRGELERMDVNQLTPLEALQKLSELKTKLRPPSPPESPP